MDRGGWEEKGGKDGVMRNRGREERREGKDAG